MALTPAHAPDHLTGIIEHVSFHSEDSGFSVLRVKVRGAADLVTVVGVLPQANAGEWLDAHGRWVVDPEYGQQFKAEVLRTTPPDTAEGVERYLASGIIKGIGAVFAARLVQAFGVGVFDVIQQAPDRLHEVEGIGPIDRAWLLCYLR